MAHQNVRRIAHPRRLRPAAPIHLRAAQHGRYWRCRRPLAPTRSPQPRCGPPMHAYRPAIRRPAERHDGRLQQVGRERREVSSRQPRPGDNQGRCACPAGRWFFARCVLLPLSADEQRTPLPVAPTVDAGHAKSLRLLKRVVPEASHMAAAGLYRLEYLHDTVQNHTRDHDQIPPLAQNEEGVV